MSGTRSASHPERAISAGGQALLIAAHGDCGGGRGNVLAMELARRMRLSHHYEEVVVGYIKGAPSIEQAAAGIAAARIHLLPLFMSDGYYVREAIPRRLGIKDGIDAMGHRVVIGTALGLLPELPRVLLEASVDAARAEGHVPSASTLLVVAHGSSKSPQSAETARSIAKQMSEHRVFSGVLTAFLEEEPFLAGVLASAPRPLFVLGLFAGCGLHGLEDLHEAVAALDDPEVCIVEQLGGYARVIELIAGRLLRD
jgi:sirohydrochlorin cobaltochelatase